MASTITRPKAIRIKNEAADYFDKLPLNKIVNSLYELMVSGRVEFDGEDLKFKGCTPTKATDIKDIEEMATLMRVPTETLLSDFRQLLEDGVLYYSGGKLINPRYEDFEQLCETKKQDPDKVIMNVIRQMGG